MEPIRIVATSWPVPVELGERIYTLIVLVVFTIVVGLGISIFVLVAGAVIKLTEDEVQGSASPNQKPQSHRIRA